LGDLDSSARDFERALSVLEAALGDKHPQVAHVLNNVADLSLQRAEFEPALEKAHQARLIAEENPDRLDAEGAMGTEAEALLELGRYEGALPLFKRFLSIQENMGASTHWLAEILADLGRTYVGLHEPEEALPLLERVVGDPGAAEGAPEYLADARFALSRALTDLRRDPKRAASLARAAQDTLDQIVTLSPLQRKKRDEIVAWRASHPG
jgi:tetratricopeptide (TPR) repeat protein